MDMDLPQMLSLLPEPPPPGYAAICELNKVRRCIRCYLSGFFPLPSSFGTVIRVFIGLVAFKKPMKVKCKAEVRDN